MIVLQDFSLIKNLGHAGTGQCVELIQYVMSKLVYGPNTIKGDQFNTSRWCAGANVRTAVSILPGTLIATFNSNGKWPGLRTGNHAAIFMSRDAGGIHVIDQYAGKEIGPRKIRYKSAADIQREKEGGGYKPSNDGNAYSIINI